MPTPTRWLDNPKISESSGSAGAGWFGAWTANSVDRPNRYNVILYEFDSHTRSRLNDPGTRGEFGNFLGDEVVFSERRPGRPANLYHGDIWADSHLGFGPKVNTLRE